MKTTLFFGFLFVVIQSFGQNKGAYRHTCGAPVQPRPAAVEESGPVTIINKSYLFDMQWRGESLVIKRFGRFKILGSGTVTDLGLNTDNPTIYGRYKVKGDTLILKCQKSIQHFNRLAEKRRVKVKMDKEYRYYIREDGKLETTEYCFWYPIED